MLFLPSVPVRFHCSRRHAVTIVSLSLLLKLLLLLVQFILVDAFVFTTQDVHTS